MLRVEKKPYLWYNRACETYIHKGALYPHRFWEVVFFMIAHFVLFVNSKFLQLAFPRFWVGRSPTLLLDYILISRALFAFGGVNCGF